MPSGRIDADAYAFVDWLAAAGQSWWQVLPLGPPDRWHSPYAPRSVFACSPALLAEPDAPVSGEQEERFREQQAFWIDGWMRAAGGRRALHDQIRFAREWERLRSYARSAGVALIGDLPLYVAPDGVDRREHPGLFLKHAVAGAPPDAYSDRGQLWGNALYDWPALRRRGYRFWIERFRRSLELFDLVRVDHFRGLVAYWSVAEGARDAREGHWRRGPGKALFDAAERALGPLPLVVEDLGVITEPVHRLRDRLELPGMVVLQFAFDERGHQIAPGLDAAPQRSVLYTSTHDHDTISGWWSGRSRRAREAIEALLAERGIADDEPHMRLIELAFSMPCELCVLGLPDLLGLGHEGRMNTPGRAGGNWRWKMAPGALTPALAKRLREATQASGRLLSRSA